MTNREWDVYICVSGVKGILEFPAAKKLRQEGPISPLFTVWEADFFGPAQSVIGQLERLFALTQELPPSDVLQANSCRTAVEMLLDIYATCGESAPDGRRRMWLWPFVLPQDFLELLRESHAAALVILAHFAGLVKCRERHHWAREGWSDSVMGMIERSLDDRWKVWLEWPKRCIRGDSGI